VHIPAIAFDRFVAILHPLHYEDRMTPVTIGRIIGVLWFVAAATSLPSYVGFATSVVRPQSCIVTFWPMYETVVELSYYVISSSVVAFVYTKIWSIAMRHETQQQQQQPQVSTVSKSVRFSAPSAQSDKRPTDTLNGTGAELPPVEETTSVPATGNPTKSRIRAGVDEDWSKHIAPRERS
jgi:hypothetical protein